MPEPRTHRTIKVTGKVQGVFFRVSAQYVAEGLGLTGYAMNNTDGSVTMEVEGPAGRIDDFVRWCHEGTTASQVANVEIEPGGLKHYAEFQIH